MKITYRNKDHSDRDLLELYKESHDLEHLGFLYKRYMSLVYGVSIKYLKDRELSRDVVMEIFEVLIEKLKEHDVQNFKSWLHVTTRNHCLMKLRKKNPETRMDEYSESIMESDPQDHHDNEDRLESDLEKLEKCIGKLKDEQKQCVTLFYLQKNSYAEIVDATGFTLKKVKSFIQNGKRNLKICIESDE